MDTQSRSVLAGLRWLASMMREQICCSVCSVGEGALRVSYAHSGHRLWLELMQRPATRRALWQGAAVVQW